MAQKNNLRLGEQMWSKMPKVVRYLKLIIMNAVLNLITSECRTTDLDLRFTYSAGKLYYNFYCYKAILLYIFSFVETLRIFH